MSPDKLTIQQIADQLAKMSHQDLLAMRMQPNVDQSYLAPYEHRAFARETVEQNPAMAVPMLTSIPAYQIAKVLGLGSDDTIKTPPSLNQAVQGGVGVFEGLMKRQMK